nr:acyltransferase family protein [Muribaculaceae bacterium]
MSQKSSVKKKLTWLLLLQGWTMLWVIIGHAPLTAPVNGNIIDETSHSIATALFSFAYSFHMPLFIMISGYLFNMTRIEKKWQYGKMLKEKWLRLGIPYIVFITLALVLKIFMPGEVDRQVSLSLTDIVMNYIDPFNGALQEMWFVAVIFIYFLLYPLYPLVLKTKLSIGITFMISLLLFFIPTSGMPHIFAIDRMIHFFIYFYSGLLISRLKLEKYLGNGYMIAIGLLIFITGYIAHIPLITPLSGSLSFWGLAIIVDKVFTNNMFSSFRNYTYQIFLIGIFVQIAVKVLASKMQFAGSYPIWWIICVFAGIFIPVGIAIFAQRTDNKILKRIMGL